jgi:3-hydroxyisobutyrate dehydrogenase
MIGWLGTGMLGSGFVRALARRGEVVQVWNRSAAKARALEPVARPCADPAAAVRGAVRVHLSLSDDAAVDDILEQARPGLTAGIAIVDHSTTSTAGTAARIARWTDRGFTFVHAPVFMGPQNAHDSTGLMLVSGDPAHLAAVQPHLAAMTGRLVELGARPDAAAAMKLMGNLFLMFMTTGLAEFFMLARATDMDPATAAKLFESFNPAATLGPRIQRMLDGNFAQPSWELAMARKDARLMLEEVARADLALAVLPAIAARMDAVIAAGHAHDDWTVIAADALARR